MMKTVIVSCTKWHLPMHSTLETSSRGNTGHYPQRIQVHQDTTQPKEEILLQKSIPHEIIPHMKEVAKKKLKNSLRTQTADRHIQAKCITQLHTKLLFSWLEDEKLSLCFLIRAG